MNNGKILLKNYSHKISCCGNHFLKRTFLGIFRPVIFSTFQIKFLFEFDITFIIASNLLLGKFVATLPKLMYTTPYLELLKKSYIS